MKKHGFLAIFMICGINLWAQTWTPGTGTLYTNPTTTNVGIGISPTSKLHVNGDVALTGYNSFWMGNNVQTSGNYLRLYQHPGLGNTYFDFAGTTTANGNLYFRSTTSLGTIVTFTSDGKVGIGTATPSVGTKLEVAGQVKITGGSPGAGKVLTSDASGLASWATPNAGTVTGTGSASRLALWSGTSALTFYSNLLWDGNTNRLGINCTSNPTKPLEVAGSGGIKISQTTAVSNTNELLFQDNGQIRSYDDNHRIIFDRTNGILELREYGDVVFSPGCSAGERTSKVTFKADGSVGIGTSTPHSMLSVKGKIWAQEVEVVADVDNVPDYVFANDYKLLPIESVKDYLKQNKHLPDVPSAEDFGRDGVNLVKMDFTLLRKIEELTLYVIDLQEKNKQLERQMEFIMKK